MENENVEIDTPVEETSIEKDGFDEVSEEILNDGFEETEEESPKEESSEENTNPSEEENEKEIDLKPFLDYLSKNVKYNKESVNVDNIDEVISNFQKGLNYDKLQNKIESLENSKALSYINQKAKELGMSSDEYMDQVMEYEKEQQRQQEEQQVQEMVENGVPEEVAREVIATKELRKQLQEEKNQLEKQKKEQEKKAKDEEEYAEFIELFPDVKAEDIPKEVFENANEKGETLTQAYKDYLYKKTKEELEILKQNQENSESAVGSTQNYGAKDKKEAKDPFLEGFDSAY